MDKKKPFAEQLAEKLIEQLKQGTAPWQRPWTPGVSSRLPVNPVTGKRYKGINTLQLMMQGHDDPRWLTYKQAAALGAQVRGGEKGTPVQYYSFTEERPRTDDHGKPVLNADGKPMMEVVRLERPKVFHATVFNASQIDNMPVVAPMPPLAWNPLERAEALLQASPAVIRHGGDRAFYRPSEDRIQLPHKEQFPSAAAYYATALHEMGHATGHSSRLDRDLAHPFGSQAYAKEELRAEIASMLLGEELGLGHDPDQHVAYVASWIEALENDPREIFRASADAEKIQTYLLGLERTLEQTPAPLAEITPVHERVYINVPRAEKDQAKALGAKWDRGSVSWYIPKGVPPDPLLAQWPAHTPSPPVPEQGVAPERFYLAVPFAEKEEAKALGAQWSTPEKSWYIEGNPDPVARWLPQRNAPQDRLSPEEEFSQALKSLGGVVASPHPIMDGKSHRLAVSDDKKGEISLFYVGHLDGHPAGFIQNNRTGQKLRWKSQGTTLSPEEKAALTATAATVQATRAAERTEKREQTAEAVAQRLQDLPPVTTPPPYLVAKGLTGTAGTFTDATNEKLFLPAMDASGKVWTLQTITPDGGKRFTKDGHKEACFHPVGGLDALAHAPVLVIAEGYATAASLAQGLGHATVAAFDAGNLKAVATALHEHFPDKPILLAGDDDRHTKANVGRAKALEAAEAVGGTTLFPTFAPGEEKGFTDFNDLATKSQLGLEGLQRQVKPVIEQALETHRAQTRPVQEERQQRSASR